MARQVFRPRSAFCRTAKRLQEQRSALPPLLLEGPWVRNTFLPWLPRPLFLWPPIRVCFQKQHVSAGTTIGFLERAHYPKRTCFQARSSNTRHLILQTHHNLSTFFQRENQSECSGETNNPLWRRRRQKKLTFLANGMT